ncbi:MAG: hypothetical protein V4565_14565 [Bacteroidota bacterium]
MVQEKNYFKHFTNKQIHYCSFKSIIVNHDGKSAEGSFSGTAGNSKGRGIAEKVM